ncbi:MAG: gephyrin-like molybdotransferase Glp [Pseudomonadales bacterium]
MNSKLMPVEEALAAILSHVKPVVAVETVPVLQALGRVLATDQYSEIDVPPCDNSAMDGYALRYADLAENNHELVVGQRIPAGHLGEPLKSATAARIFTGAAIPPGADTVVMQEDTELLAKVVRINTAVKFGQHIRPRGQDIASGSVVVHKGKRLQPQDIGLLASIGATEVEVFKRLSVAVMSTGDELVEPGEPLAEGQIYNSNRYTLSALLMALGCDVVDGGIVADDFSSTCDQLNASAEKADLIISTGGVSVGEEDHIKAAVTSLGELALWKLNIKPGKPLAFGVVGGTPFFGLPGNPSSVFVTFCLLARPYVLRCQGQVDVAPSITHAVADFNWSRRGSRQEYLRARVMNSDVGSVVELYPNQGSGLLASASWANGLVILPPETTVVKGDTISVILLSELLR